MNDNARPEPPLVLGGTGKTGRRVVDRLTHAEDPVPSSISVVAGGEDVQGTDQPSGRGRRFPCGVVAGRVRSLTHPFG